MCHHTKERVEQIGQDDRHGVGAVVLQPLGVGVDVVVQRLDGLFYLFTVLITHWDAVDDLGYSAQRDPCLLGTSFIVGAVFCFAMRATPLFVKRFYFKWIYIKGNLAVFLLTLRFLQLQYSMVFPECKDFFREIS